jgi:protein O-GlcNAc transferase
MAQPPGTVRNASSVDDLLRAGLKHHQGGQLDEAERLYRQILSLDTLHADSLHLLGVIAYQRGLHSNAVELINKAIGLNNGVANFHNNLGNVFRDQSRLAEAVACFERALALKPGYAEAHSNLGNVFRDQSRLAEAVACFERALALEPDLAEVHNSLGSVFRDQGKLAEATACFERALALKPGYAEAHSNLGNVFRDQGKLAEAIVCFERALALKPGYAEVHSNLGNVFRDQGRLAEAIACFERALTLKPGYAEAHSNLGNVFLDQGKLAEAAACYERALALKPDYAKAHNNLGKVFLDQGKLAEAVACYERALALKPDYVKAHNNLGNVFLDQGKLAEAVACYERALAFKPGYAKAGSNLVYCLNYNDTMTAPQLFAAHCDWNKRFSCPDLMPKTYANNCTPGRRLKIGYVSPDLRDHSVAYFIEVLLREHDREVVEIYSYADVVRPDAVTERLRGFTDHWVATVGLSHDNLAERIRTDGIDILVDLAGHTAKNRLPVFARKPAPVQVTWLGYPNTTGLAAIDYRLVDAITDPYGAADAWASETLVRLEGGFLCYAAPKNAPIPSLPPCLTNGRVTFGSFNNPAKLSPATLDVWARLLNRLPQSRLLLKGKPFADATTRALLLSRLEERGLAAERVELVAWIPSQAAHLALYNRLDIALDPFPYNGTTTTCEALCMGVPVVTLCGDRHAGRVGASLLNQVGLTDWIAGSIDEYLEIAVNFAGAPSQLAELRHDLRPRLSRSPLCDGRKFARKIEAAYRTMWLRWCETTPKNPQPISCLSGAFEVPVVSEVDAVDGSSTGTSVR